MVKKLGVSDRSVHLPKKVMDTISAMQALDHPDIPMEPFSTDVIIKEEQQKVQIKDTNCKSGKRWVHFTLQYFQTHTVTGKFTEDPDHPCSYKITFTVTVSEVKTRIKPGTYRVGDCVEEG